MQGITSALAAFAADLTYERLPPEVVQTLKQIVLDTLGTTLAANTLGAGCQELLALARSSSGSPESTLIGLGMKVPAVMAALVNGGLAHALNYDCSGQGGHVGATTLPAALATAEQRGAVSGKELLAALAAGAEIQSRIGAAVAAAEDSERKILRGQLWGYFGAAASAGRVLRLPPHQMHHALGLALMQAGGTRQVVLDGDPPAKAVYAAFPNQAGTLSAFLARAGLNAAYAVFEGEAGFFALFYEGVYNETALDTTRNTHQFYLLDTAFKPWPTTAVAHPFIEAALKVRADHGIAGDEIESVRVRGGAHIRPWCEPLSERQRPQNAAAAANSVIFAVAKALANRNVTLADFTPNGLRQPEALRLAERTSYVIEGDLGETALVEVTTASGQHVMSRVDIPRGHPPRPLTFSQLTEKFLDCAQYAAVPLRKETLERVVGSIEHLEEIEDVSTLLSLISGDK